MVLGFIGGLPGLLQSRRLRRDKPGAEAQEAIHDGKFNFLDAVSHQLSAPTGQARRKRKNNATATHRRDCMFIPRRWKHLTLFPLLSPLDLY